MNNVAQKVTGVILTVKGQIATCEIDDDLFPLHREILISPDDKDVCLEVFSQTENKTYCQILSNPDKLFRGMKVLGTDSDLKIPVGKSVLGRVIDLFGNARDNLGSIKKDTQTSIYSKVP